MHSQQSAAGNKSVSKRINNTASGTVLNLFFHVYRGRGRGRRRGRGRERGEGEEEEEETRQKKTALLTIFTPRILLCIFN